MTKEILCRRCLDVFKFTQAEQREYLAKGWADPKHCPACRAIRRKQNADRFFGWRYTMYYPTKRYRIHRVNYAPFVAGGFR